MKNPSTALADARIRVAQIERQLRAARIAEATAEALLARAEQAALAETVRPPAPDVDSGWEP